jgi:hypothetical protein
MKLFKLILFKINRKINLCTVFFPTFFKRKKKDQDTRAVWEHFFFIFGTKLACRCIFISLLAGEYTQHLGILLRKAFLEKGNKKR